MFGNYVAGAVLLIIAAVVVGVWLRDLRKDRGPAQPLGTIARLYGVALALYVAAAAYSLSRGSGSGGPSGSVCVDTGFPANGGPGPGIAAKAGASISAIGSVQACALHPTLTHWGWYLLTKLPPIVLWGALLVTIWRLAARVARGGPFTAEAATTMRRLGWLVIGGSMICGALVALGTDMLTGLLMSPDTYSAGGTVGHVLVYAPLRALLPVPALAGAALLAFARITRAGTALDEEIKATI